MRSVRLLHLSDLHLASPRPLLNQADRLLGAARPEVVLSVVRCLLHERASTDALLITGDLAESGFRRSLHTALDFVDDTIGRLGYSGRTLTSFLAHRPLLLLPGNHDRYNRLTRMPGSNAFDAVFGPPGHWTVGQGVAAQTIAGADGDGMAILLADFSLRSEERGRKSVLDVLGQGRIYREVLDELVALTRTARASELAVVWAIHFTPGPVERTVQLEDWRLLIGAAEQERVQHILGGHIHAKGVVVFEGTSPSVVFIRAGSACAGRPFYHPQSKRWREPNTFLHLSFGIEDGFVKELTSVPFSWDSTRKSFRKRQDKKWTWRSHEQ